MIYPRHRPAINLASGIAAMNSDPVFGHWIVTRRFFSDGTVILGFSTVAAFGTRTGRARPTAPMRAASAWQSQQVARNVDRQLECPFPHAEPQNRSCPRASARARPMR